MWRNTDMVKSWSSCERSVRISSGDEYAYLLHEEGIVERFGCICSQVVKTATTLSGFLEDGKYIPVAILYEMGKPDDPEVVEELTGICGQCKYFKEKN